MFLGASGCPSLGHNMGSLARVLIENAVFNVGLSAI